MAYSLLILPGDGIGPEVMAEVRKIIDWYGDKRGIQFDVSEDLIGGAAYDAHGTPLADSTLAKAQEVDAVLLGAVGGPAYDNLDFSVKPDPLSLARFTAGSSAGGRKREGGNPPGSTTRIRSLLFGGNSGGC